MRSGLNALVNKLFNLLNLVQITFKVDLQPLLHLHNTVTQTLRDTHTMPTFLIMVHARSATCAA
jgi:hypothetical protein